MFVWMQGNSFTRIATIYNGNITLNTPCLKYFVDAKWCLIGIDRVDKKIAIKAVTNEELNKNKFMPEVLNKVSLGKSYARISNKNIVLEISKIVGKKCNGEKFIVSFDEKENQIVIDLNNGI